MIPTRMFDNRKRGCPTCAGVDAKSCWRCQGTTRLCDWYQTDSGCVPFHGLTSVEQDAVRAEYVKRTRAKRP